MSKKKRFKILSYNIHKGLTQVGSRSTLSLIKLAIQRVGADIVFLQEVLGDHKHPQKKIKKWPTNSQFEYLADKSWPHFAYGKNAVYTDGHHGNAILSKYPFMVHENIDISTIRFARRGLLHGVLEIPPTNYNFHVICLHLDLHEAGRAIQTSFLVDRIKESVPLNEPLIIAGDFNDWRARATETLAEELRLKEAFLDENGMHAKTYPARLPLLQLDRIYYRGLKLVFAEVLSQERWRKLSDHLPLSATFEIG